MFSNFFIQRKLSTAFEIPFSDLKAEPMMLPAGSDSSFLIKKYILQDTDFFLQGKLQPFFQAEIPIDADLILKIEEEKVLELRSGRIDFSVNKKRL